MQTANADFESDPRTSSDPAQGHLWFLENMDRVHRAIQGSHDLDELMGDVLDVALLIFDCDRALLAHPCDPETLMTSQ